MLLLPWHVMSRIRPHNLWVMLGTVDLPREADLRRIAPLKQSGSRTDLCNWGPSIGWLAARFPTVAIIR